MNYLERIQNTADFLKGKLDRLPKTGIVLGTGLGNLIERIQIDKVINYTDIPNFPVSTVEGHSGRLIFGTLGGKYVMAMQGRFHYYEGYEMRDVTFPVRVMKALGVKTLFVSNASGGMNPKFKIGDLMIITDHINLFPEHPLRGKNFDELGPRFPGMGHTYSERLIEKARQIGRENNIELQEGTYVGTQGPTFETPSEYRYFWRIGGDCVGMSTVPEVIVARHGDMEVFGISVITDMGNEGHIEKVSHEEVQKAAAAAEPKMTFIIEQLIASFEEL